MTDWGGGYVTDVTYMPGYYRQQSPAHMALACTLGSVAAATPTHDAPYHYVELGCGHGFGSLLLAASNPGWRVTAIDFNPGHTAEAREWAAAAEIDNIRFLEADLSRLAEDEMARDIPMADAVSMHGVWSWVPQAVRDGIVRLLAAKVAPGGMVHVSYNSLPAWQGMMGMQRVLLEAGRRLPARSDRQMQSGLKFVEELNAAEALHFKRQHMAQALLARMADMPVAYLTHEYMNQSWQPCFHADVAQALGAAKLDWVASGNLTENFPELTLTEEQRELYRRYDDPLMQELVKDVCLERGLRHDVYVRGVRRLSTAQRDDALRAIHLGLSIPAEEFAFEATMPAGKATLAPDFYRPIVAELAKGPRRVAELLTLGNGARSHGNPAELVGILVGLDRATPLPNPLAELAPGAARLNRTIGQRIASKLENVGGATALASTAAGAAVPAAMVEVIIQWRLQLGEQVDRLDEWVLALGPTLAREQQDKIRTALQTAIARRMPILRSLGAV